ncbi:MAG: hypothetical protein EA405_12340 [Rhodospirillales bacterium]|nr:MAG: hypothetical protein EA405_12340 [Rhodospirillales bacterium]
MPPPRRHYWIMSRFAAALSGVLVVVLLAMQGCTYPVQRQRLPDITFEHQAPLVLDVAEIRITSSHGPGASPHHVENRVPVPPEAVLRRWARDRLNAAGRSGTARFEITEASVVRTELPRTGGLRGLFTEDQSERYDAVAAATLEILDQHGLRLAYVQTRAERSRSVSERATLDERDRVRFEMIETLMREFDAEMEKAMRRHLGGWLM